MRRQTEQTAPFQTIASTARITGLSACSIRQGVRDGTIPHVRRGDGGNAVYLVNLPLFLRLLEGESLENLRGNKEAPVGAATPAEAQTRGCFSALCNAPQMQYTTACDFRQEEGGR